MSLTSKQPKDKILLVSSDHSVGMIHFAASLINKLSESEELDIHALLTAKESYNYNNKLTLKAKERTTIIECQHNKIMNGIYKIIPIDIICAIKRITKEYDIKKIHFITGDFRMWSVIEILNYKYYYTVHDLRPHERKLSSFTLRVLQKYMNWSYQYNTKHIANLITCSQDQYNELKSIYPDKNIHFAHFPSLINDEIINGSLKVPELNKIKDYILFFGGVDYYKGVDTLIDAYELIKGETSIPLVIAGKGLKFNNKDIITINRVIDNKEIRDLFSKARIVVYPYRSITMSGVLSFAYYFNKNVIVSDLGFFLQNKSKNTFVFKRNDAQDLAKVLTKALEMPADMSSAYNEIYSSERMIKEYLAFYNS